jgi:hypothetical protein
MRTPVTAGRGLVVLAACMLSWSLSVTLFGNGPVQMLKICSLQSKRPTICCGSLLCSCLKIVLMIKVAACGRCQLDGLPPTLVPFELYEQI